MVSDDLMREISRFADFEPRLFTELIKYGRVSTSKKYNGPFAFFVCEDSVEFFTEKGFDGVHHPDGFYGWRSSLSNHGVEKIHLACSHGYVLKHKESVVRVASMIVELAAKADINSHHLSRDASSLTVPQEDSMCGYGPSCAASGLVDGRFCVEETSVPPHPYSTLGPSPHMLSS